LFPLFNTRSTPYSNLRIPEGHSKEWHKPLEDYPCTNRIPVDAVVKALTKELTDILSNLLTCLVVPIRFPSPASTIEAAHRSHEALWKNVWLNSPRGFVRSTKTSSTTLHPYQNS
ncbi:hypothetical protein KCV07_g347, partial [Aureobasidium melanogenum]